MNDDWQKIWESVTVAQEAWELLDQGENKDAQAVATAVVRVLEVLHDHAAVLQEVTQAPIGAQQDVANRPKNLTELKSRDALVEYMRQFTAVVLINGHGSKGEYGDLTHVDWIVDHLVQDLDERFGSNYLIVYGGEPY